MSDYLLGRCFSLLAMIRGYLIRTENTDGLSILENDYQDIKNDIEKNYYTNPEI